MKMKYHILQLTVFLFNMIKTCIKPKLFSVLGWVEWLKPVSFFLFCWEHSPLLPVPETQQKVKANQSRVRGNCS